MEIVDARAPSYQELRPLRVDPGGAPAIPSAPAPQVRLGAPPVTAPPSRGFPVYGDLTGVLCGELRHPDDMVANVLSTAAGYAYSDAATEAAMMARAGLAENACRMISETVEQMFIRSVSQVIQSQDGRVVILAYRGTNPRNLFDWLTDADADPDMVQIPFRDHPGSFAVHAGFYRNVHVTKHEVIAALERARQGGSVTGQEDSDRRLEPMQALYLTGHSLGGAMAALMAMMLITDPAYAGLAERLRAVYTFGQPMIGSPELAQACEAHPFFSANVIRYVYRHDIVPYLPPRFSGPFAHFAPEYHFDGQWPWRPRTPLTAQLGHLLALVGAPLEGLSRKLSWLRNLQLHYSINDHSAHNYVTQLTPPDTPLEFGDHTLAR